MPAKSGGVCTYTENMCWLPIALGAAGSARQADATSAYARAEQPPARSALRGTSPPAASNHSAHAASCGIEPRVSSSSATLGTPVAAAQRACGAAGASVTAVLPHAGHRRRMHSPWSPRPPAAASAVLDKRAPAAHPAKQEADAACRSDRCQRSQHTPTIGLMRCNNVQGAGHKLQRCSALRARPSLRTRPCTAGGRSRR